MPRTTVYIRQDDWDKWKLIENKAELISQAINRSIIQPVQKTSGEIKTIQTIQSPKPKPEPLEKINTIIPESIPPCCKLAKPCRHWEPDSLNSRWVNTLTGEAREFF